ncbi:MAG: cation diffusion facilitator family transporter [Candidatus Rokuibacteriota bacterium]
MGHHHHANGVRPHRALLGALVVSSVFLVVEVLGAWWTGSLALAADAGHMFADVGGLALALFASWIATRPPTPAKTYGYQRAEILAALLNSLVLLVLAGAILYEAVQRLREPHPVPGGPLLVIGSLGLAANALSAWMLRRQARGNLNVRAAYLEVLGDALGSVGVLVAAVVIMLTGWSPIDSLVSVAIGLFIVVRTWRLLAQVVNVLLEGTPAHLDIGEIEAAMRSVIGVRRVHELHVWTLTSGRDAMSAHVVVDDMGESNRLLDELHRVLHTRFGVDHTTIQLERDPEGALQIKRPVAGGT